MGFLRVLLVIPSLAAGLLAATTRAAEPAWPQRVLITNDNGIDDPRMIELARAIAKFAEVTVVAATSDRSGTSNLISASRTGQFRVEPKDLGSGIEAYALDGYPADCVVFGLAALMRDNPPDLVLSGINGGANLGDAWFGSGTIGAARTAAYFGVPAIALSGLRSRDLEAREAVIAWIVEFIGSSAVRQLQAPQYLTVSFPRVPASEIRGVTIAERARGLLGGRVERDPDGGSEPVQTWILDVIVNESAAAPGSDVALARDNRIAIVPMRVDESDAAFAELLRSRSESIPAWKPTADGARKKPKCRPGFGAMINDAEDDQGHEWGVLIEEILSGGRAEEMDLREKDVIVEVNGVSMAENEISRDDPVSKFQRVLAKLDCGDVVAIEYVRGPERQKASFEISTPNR